MSERKRPDLRDPYVKMACEVDHVPFVQYEDGEFVGTTCEACQQEWPCAIRVELGFTSASIYQFLGDDYRVIKVPPGVEDFAYIEGRVLVLEECEDEEEEEEEAADVDG